LAKVILQVNGRPEITHHPNVPLFPTLSKGYLDLFPFAEKEKRPNLLSFHSRKIAKIYSSPRLPKSRLLFCKHPVLLSGGCLEQRRDLALGDS
jgi:hypothetical protein